MSSITTTATAANLVRADILANYFLVQPFDFANEKIHFARTNVFFRCFFFHVRPLGQVRAHARGQAHRQASTRAGDDKESRGGRATAERQGTPEGTRKLLTVQYYIKDMKRVRFTLPTFSKGVL